MNAIDTASRSYHYGVVARAIAAIAARAPEQVPLEILAQEAAMSPAHFQRVFSRWAGVSPKRFAQFLALDAARHALAAQQPVTEAAAVAGLTGPGRLHDLFLTWEAMTPGTFARGGEGLAIAWCAAETPFGPAVAMATDKGLCGLGFAAETGIEATRAELSARWPRARYREDPAAVEPLLEGVFETSSPAVPRLHLIGGPFQIKVWEALLSLPAAGLASYTEIAAAIGRPGAARAVGNAVGANPVSWLVPCHRVLRREGGLGGYRWGLGVKRAMLAVEAARVEAGARRAAAGPGTFVGGPGFAPNQNERPG